MIANTATARISGEIRLLPEIFCGQPLCPRRTMDSYASSIREAESDDNSEHKFSDVGDDLERYERRCELRPADGWRLVTTGNRVLLPPQGYVTIEPQCQR